MKTRVQVKALGLPWPGRDHEKFKTGWRLEMQYFQFTKPFAAVEFLPWNRANRRPISKKITTQPGIMNNETLSDFAMDIKSFRQIQSLGYGSFGTAKLMSDIDLQQFATKYFDRGIPLPDKTIGHVFSRELDAFCHLNQPFVLCVYRFSRDIRDYEGPLAMEYMPNWSLDHIFERVRQGNLPDFWNGTGVAIIVCGIVVRMEFIHETWFIAI
jgi:hypothetical protein